MVGFFVEPTHGRLFCCLLRLLRCSWGGGRRCAFGRMCPGGRRWRPPPPLIRPNAHRLPPGLATERPPRTLQPGGDAPRRPTREADHGSALQRGPASAQEIEAEVGGGAGGGAGGEAGGGVAFG